MNSRARINNQIRSPKVRVIDEEGNQLGVLDLNEALEIAKSKGFDLIQVTEKVEPPVCKIMDHGKFVYHQKKREKQPKHKGGEVKGIRLSFGISDHDMEVRAIAAEKFLKIGDAVRIEMYLRGREKSHFDFAKGKIDKFIEILKQKIPVKVESQIKRGPRGLTILVSYDKTNIIKETPKN